MSLLFRIVYAAHANGTHHKLALDGLRSMTGTQAAEWTRLFLKHADRFMVGSKAPDDTFKDFKNHVLHVGDSYWGGAPEATVEWYGRTVAALREQRWPDAVYAAGVTSHYYCDPIMPFHTGQTDAENAIHRATEWSINRSYNDLRRLGEARSAALEVPKRDGADWLKAMVCDGAEASHRSYERLIAHYDIHRGVTDPPSGLDGIARGFVAELLIYAATGFGRILDRAFDEAQVAPPPVSLTLDTIVAAIKIPAKALAKRLSNAEDRAIVEAMYDELKTTGRVEKTLPEDDRMVRDLHAKEVLAPQIAIRAAARATRLKSTPAQSAPSTAAPKEAAAAAAEIAKRTQAALAGTIPVKPNITPAAPPRPQPQAASNDAAAAKPASTPMLAPQIRATAAVLPPVAAQAPRAEPQPVAPPAGAVAAPTKPAAMPASPAAVTPPKPEVAPAVVAAAQGLVSRLASTATPAPAKPVTAASTSVPSIAATTAERVPRAYLAASDQLEAAPSIGPKMAERFAGLGVKTVADFLAANPPALAARLADRRIDAAMIEQWQAQARMVMTVAGLRGTNAQLLTGAGYNTAAAVAAADPDKLAAAVIAYAAGAEGQRLLRDSPPPEPDKIKGWVAMARAAARAK